MFSRTVVVPLLCICVGSASVSGCAEKKNAARQVDLLIKGGTVIDPGSKSTIENALIAIDDGRIVAVEQNDGAYSATRTIDASGQYVVPAFVDMHVHWGNGTFAESENIVETTLARSLYYGVTRILNMGSNAASPQEIDQFRLKLEDRTWEGPQIYAVGALISVPGSHPTTTIFPPPIQKQIEQQVTAAPEHGAIDLMPLGAITLVRSPDDVRSEVKRLAAWGADAIKLTIESGPGPFGNDHPQMSEEIARAAVEQAHAAGIPVVAHVSARDDLDTCLRAGVDGAAHAAIDGPFDAELHAQMGKAGFFYTVTLNLYDGFLNWTADPKRMEDPFLRETLTDEEVASMSESAMIFAHEREYFGKQGLAPILNHVRDAHQAGAILLTGTDAGNPFAFPGYGVHEELRLMVEAGIPPIDALAASSANAARYFNEQAQWGSIAVGQAADLLILGGDPLADIANTRRISHVIQRGRVIDRAGLRVK